MKRALVYLEENLPSSLALRFADSLAAETGMSLVPVHVEEPDRKLQAGTGWVRRSWEQGVIESGVQEIRRLLKTEKVTAEVSATPVVTVGDRDEEVVSAWRAGNYALYVEGYLNTANDRDFIDFLDSDRMRRTGGPILVVKNLVPAGRLLLLVGEGVDGKALVECVGRLYGQSLSSLEVTVLHFQFQNTSELKFKERSESGGYIDRVVEALAAAGAADPECQVVEGTPEQAAFYLRDHGLVATAFPERKGVRMELLAQLVNPLLLCKQK